MAPRAAVARVPGWLAAGSAMLLAAGSLGAADRPLAAEGSSSESWRIETADSQAKIEPNAPVRIVNRFGDVRLRSNPVPELLLRVAHQHASDEPALRVELTPEQGGWSLTVSEPTGGPRRDQGPPRRADLAVALPPGCPVTVIGGQGLVEARGFAAPLAIETTSGEIRLRGSGAVRLRSTSGAIRVAFHPGMPPNPSRLESTTGAIEVELPAHSSFDAHLESQGAFTTDFTLAVERVGPLTKRGRARLGSGAPELWLASRTGALSLLERVADSSATPL